jgi:hypothetical protein
MSNFPRLPPPPADPGEFLSHFGAYISGFRIDKFGKLVLSVTVDDADKYLAMPLTDIRGRSFNISVYAERGRTPLVARSGELLVHQGRARSKDRRADRRWERARREMFEGSMEGPDA